VLSPATLPGKASGIGTQIIVGVGALLGLLAGLVLAVALTRSDKRVRRSAVMVEDVPVLSVLGARRRLFRARSSEQPQRGLRSSYQRLRIGALAAVPPSSSIALSALAEHDEVGDIAAELGSSFTRAGYRVMVVVATAERTATAALDVSDEPGLSDVLAGAADAHEVLLDRAGVQVMAPGRDIEEVQERLSGDRFKSVLHDLAETCDYVLVIGPHATTPSGVAVGRASTAMLLVGRELRTTSIDVEDATDRAELVGAHVIGLVLRSRERRSFSVRRRSGSPAGPAGPAGPAVSSTSSGTATQPAGQLVDELLPPHGDMGQPTPAQRDAVAIAASVAARMRSEATDSRAAEMDGARQLEFLPEDEDFADLDEDTELADLDEDVELADLDEDAIVWTTSPGTSGASEQASPPGA
jgi:Mrp family chromosome partitioning ATPase